MINGTYAEQAEGLRFLQGNPLGHQLTKHQVKISPVSYTHLSSTGMAEISCCGRKLNALKARPADLSHSVSVKAVEGDYYITLEHDMEKQHYITFMAYAVYDRVLLMKLYPEQAAQVRFPRSCLLYTSRCV